MAAVTVVITGSSVDENGRLTINTADGNNYEVGTIDDLKAEIDQIHSDPRTAVVAAAGVAWLGIEPTGDRRTTLLDGKTITFDLLRSDKPIWVR